MKFSSLGQCIDFLEKQGELVRITRQVDPDLEMAEITRQVFNAQGPALLFSNISNSKFSAVSNLFGTWKRTLKIFEPQLASVKALIDIRSDPGLCFRNPGRILKAIPALVHSMPLKTRAPKVAQNRCTIDDLPMIRCWPEDGGAFILLPQVFSTDPETDNIFTSNLGMYRIQISGNEYDNGREIGLHYQLHRGIGNHHKKALEMKKPLRVSIFIGGPPAHTLAAIMPLPENVPEIAFAGALAGKNFRYCVKNGFVLSGDADFCITGTIDPGRMKPEGPFGDHLGYYSLEHEYPFVRVENVYHRPNAVFPFTIVGRPPQEDSNFGKLIHELTGSAIKHEIPGVTAVNAVDDAGVHPLLLAKAHERYLPFEKRKPREILTHAARILGTGQLSLAKYLFICAHEDSPGLDVRDEKAFFAHMLERIDFKTDLHFITHTTMDTLDYSSSCINQGSKLIAAAAGEKKRILKSEFSESFSLPEGFCCPQIAAPGIIVVKGPEFTGYSKGRKHINSLKKHLAVQKNLSGFPLVVVADDPVFAARTFSNFLWVCFSRSNPSHDVYGVGEKTMFKHWQCAGPLIIDARIKPFHARELVSDRKTAEKVRELAVRGGPLAGII